MIYHTIVLVLTLQEGVTVDPCSDELYDYGALSHEQRVLEFSSDYLQQISEQQPGVQFNSAFLSKLLAFVYLETYFHYFGHTSANIHGLF